MITSLVMFVSQGQASVVPLDHPQTEDYTDQ